MKRSIKMVIILIVAMLLLTSCSDKEETKITKEMYDNIEIGMTIDEVEEVLGKGEENAKSEAAGTIISSMQWVNKDGGNIQIMFQDGKVDTKAQAGLE